MRISIPETATANFTRRDYVLVRINAVRDEILDLMDHAHSLGGDPELLKRAMVEIRSCQDILEKFYAVFLAQHKNAA